MESEKIYETDWHDRACPLCGESELLKLLSHRSLKLAVDDGWFIFEQYDTACKRCGFIFNSKIPDEQFIADYYTRTAIRISADYDSESRLELIKKLIPTGSKLIEFGSGRGEFAELLKKNGYHVDQNDFIKSADMRADYDAALAYYVIEHVIDPCGFICKMRFALKDNGIIIVEVPDYHNYTEHSLYLEHMNHFTVPHMITLLTMHNFQVIEIHPGHSRDFGFVAVAIKGFSQIASSKYFKTYNRIKDYWKAQ